MAVEALQERPGAPPWLWLWVLLYALNVPRVIEAGRSTVQTLTELHQSTARLQVTDPGFGRLEFLTWPGYSLELWPAAALLVGLGLVLVPRLRARYLERRFRLELPARLPVTLKEIEAFLAVHRVHAPIQLNLRRSQPLAFVYPNRQGRPVLALFGGFFKLWRSNRQAAEAVLLHELVHLRWGDARVIGVGSPFEALLRYSVLGLLLLVIVPFGIGYADQFLQAREQFQALGIPEAMIRKHQAGQVGGRILPGLLLICAGFMCQLAAQLVIPLAGIWSAELNADHVAARKQGEGMNQGLLVLGGSRSWLRWLLFRLSHPPTWLRRRLLGARGHCGLAGLLLLFPLAHALQWVLLQGLTLSTYLQMKVPASTLWEGMRTSMRSGLSARPLVWLVMAALLLGWPALRASWERWFSGEAEPSAPAPFHVYALCALLTGTVGIAGYLLR
ncbi:hypothetical protein F0U59_38440 [Archangium gephyra]|nr:hypothetical protein F0U59_38440 [Archangium gephyra]